MNSLGVKSSQQATAADALDFIQPGKKKNRRGNELRTPCPVHDGDGAENFAINLSTHEWFCHSQQCKGSNLIDLYAQSRKIPFPEAASELANQFGIKIDYRKSREFSPENYKPEYVLRCLEESKKQGNDVYFKREGLTPPSIVRYGKNPFGYDCMLVPLRDVEEDFKGFICLQENEKYKKRNPLHGRNLDLISDLAISVRIPADPHSVFFEQ